MRVKYQGRDIEVNEVETVTANEVVPFDKNVSKVPELTTGYITISADTDNEEIFFYN